MNELLAKTESKIIWHDINKYNISKRKIISLKQIGEIKECYYVYHNKNINENNVL